MLPWDLSGRASPGSAGRSNRSASRRPLDVKRRNARRSRKRKRPWRTPGPGRPQSTGGGDGRGRGSGTPRACARSQRRKSHHRRHVPSLGPEFPAQSPREGDRSVRAGPRPSRSRARVAENRGKGRATTAALRSGTARWPAGAAAYFCSPGGGRHGASRQVRGARRRWVAPFFFSARARRAAGHFCGRGRASGGRRG